MIPSPTPEPDADDDPCWLALRYVLDDLDEDRRVAFETQLEFDPKACEEVAEAVELIGACVAVRETSPRVPFKKPGRKLAGIGLMGLAAAAAVLLASSLIKFGPSNDPGETIALELAWSGLDRETIPDPVDPDLDPWPVQPIADLSSPAIDEDHGDIEDDDQSEPALPEWLIAAVALDDESPDHEPKPLEN